MAEKPPTSTIKIEKTIRNAPVTEDDMEEATMPTHKKKRVPPQEIVTEGEVDQFAEMLNDHTVKIHVDRVSPKEWHGKQISGMIEEYVPPTTLEEMETDIRNRFGGGRYRVRAMKNGKFLGARGISVYGDPKIMDDEEDDDGFEPNFPPRMNPFMRPGGPYPVAGDDETSDLRKQIEREKLKKVLKDVKGEEGRTKVDADKIRRETEEKIHSDYQLRGAIKDLRNDMDHRFTDMVSGLRETLSPKESSAKEDMKILELENRIERIKGEVSSEIKGLNSDIKSMFSEYKRDEPKQPDTTPQLLQAIIGGFAQMANSGDGRMQAMADAERIKAEALLTSVREMNNANAKVAQAQSEKMVAVFQAMNQGGDMSGVAKAVTSVRDIAEAMGMGSGGGGGDAEPQDAVSRIISLVEKALPTIMAAAKQKEQQQPGNPSLNKDELARIIQYQAKQAVQQSGIVPQQPVAQPALPEPQVNGPQAWKTPDTLESPVQEAYTPELPSEPVPIDTTIPSGSGTGSSVTPEVVTQGEQAPPSEDPIYKEYYMRVNACLEHLVREVQIRPRHAGWNEYALDNLPQTVLDKLILATDAEGVLASVEEYAHPEFIDYLKKVFQVDKRATDWFVEGLNDMKEWYANGDHEESSEVPKVPEAPRVEEQVTLPEVTEIPEVPLVTVEPPTENQIEFPVLPVPVEDNGNSEKEPEKEVASDSSDR